MTIKELETELNELLTRADWPSNRGRLSDFGGAQWRSERSKRWAGRVLLDRMLRQGTAYFPPAGRTSNEYRPFKSVGTRCDSVQCSDGWCLRGLVGSK